MIKMASRMAWPGELVLFFVACGPTAETSNASGPGDDPGGRCQGGQAEVLTDFSLSSSDGNHGAPGIRVAATQSATWMATAGEETRYLISVDRMGEATQLDVLPKEFIRKEILIAAAPDGTLHVMADATQEPDFSGGLMHMSDKTGWVPSIVYDGPVMVPVVDIDVAADGTPSVWFEGVTPGMGRATPAGDGWSIEPVVVTSSWTHFALTTDGAPLVAAMGNDSQLSVLVDGQRRPLGRPITGDAYSEYVLSPAPPGPDPDGPRYAVALQDTDNVRVAWPVAEGYEESAIPGSAVFAEDCRFGSIPPCAEPCHDRGGGVEPGAVAFARTADGTGWLAFVETRLEQQVSFKETCSDPRNCYCAKTVEADASTAVLHLFRVPFDGAPACEALTLPTQRLALRSLFSGVAGDASRAIDMRAHGAELALGLRTQSSEDGERTVRLLRIDTAPASP